MSIRYYRRYSPISSFLYGFFRYASYRLGYSLLRKLLRKFFRYI
ncbi:hypothetical protein [Fervidobacterium thailandense]|nr:hypothetical protein [Fervidobacterium thailandense]